METSRLARCGRIVLLAFLLALPSAPIRAAQIYAIDGDTIVISNEHIRLANIDAPEIGHYKCDAELQLGLTAKARMGTLLAQGKVTLIRGDWHRMKDRYGRSLARVLIDGRDAGEILIAEGLARRWDGHRHQWCS